MLASHKWIVYCSVAVFLVITLWYTAGASSFRPRLTPPAWKGASNATTCVCKEEKPVVGSCEKDDHAKDPPKVLLGPATDAFRENLLNDTYYVTSWSNAGFTNQLISYINLIYLATITDRVPILPPFVPDHHISREAGVLHFSEVFNLTYLRHRLHIPIVEWFEVKHLHSTKGKDVDVYATDVLDPLGCWSTRNTNEADPIWATNVVHRLGLDVSYTRVPDFVRSRPGDGGDVDVHFDKLAATVFPRTPHWDPSTYPLMKPSPQGTRLSPDLQVSCYDYLFTATSGVEGLEWRYPWSPAWRVGGRNLRFTQQLHDLGVGYLKRTFHKSESESLPPFIAVHMRRGDFLHRCPPTEVCLAPVVKYSKMVDEVKKELEEKRGVEVQHVFATSDEEDPAFWVKLEQDYGWKYINHTAERTLEKYGEWYPPLVDTVAHSLAVGFVGTLDSTFSHVSQRRVEDWNDGISRIVGLAD